MKYERLTNGNFDGQCDHWTSLAFMGGEIGCWNEAEERYMLCEECIHKQRYDRLKELEDKIENGALVELPYKLGDLIWCVCWKPNDTYDIIPTTVDSYLIDEDGGVQINMSPQFEKPIYINIDCVFATKAEAEKQLEESRGENKEG